MKQSLKRTLLASLLLALYAFVALPASLWHHHHCNHGTVVSKQLTDVLTAKGKTVSQAGCDICNHQYSVYDGGSNFEFFCLKPVATLSFASMTPQLPDAFILKASNKGPPALA